MVDRLVPEVSAAPRAELYRVPEAAKVLAVSDKFLYAKIAAGEFPHVRIGRAVRVPYKSLIEYIERNTEGTTDGAR